MFFSSKLLIRTEGTARNRVDRRPRYLNGRERKSRKRILEWLPQALNAKLETGQFNGALGRVGSDQIRLGGGFPEHFST